MNANKALIYSSILLPLLAALILMESPASAQVGSKVDQEDPFVRCTRCKNLGRKECPEHDKLELEQELAVDYCSFVADCEVCLGTGWVDCDHCENPAVESRLKAKQAKVDSLRAEMKLLDDTMGRRLRKVAVPHFVVVCEVDRWKVKKKYYSDHDLAHLYSSRLLSLYADYKRILGATDDEFQERIKLLMWDFQEDHEDAALRFTEITGKTGVKLLGLHPTYCVPVTRVHFDNDEQLHRNVVHSVTHLLLSHQKPALWVGNIKGGWADEGLAHWFEERLDGLCDNYCYQEVDLTSGRGFAGGKYRIGLRKALQKGKLPTVAETLAENSDTMSVPMNALSFAIVDYLINLDAKKTNQVFKHLRNRESTRSALKEVFGFGPLQLEERVKAWIEAEYPIR